MSPKWPFEKVGGRSVGLKVHRAGLYHDCSVGVCACKQFMYRYRASGFGDRKRGIPKVRTPSVLCLSPNSVVLLAHGMNSTQKTGFVIMLRLAPARSGSLWLSKSTNLVHIRFLLLCVFSWYAPHVLRAGVGNTFRDESFTYFQKYSNFFLPDCRDSRLVLFVTCA